MVEIICVGVGGFLGSCLRFGITKFSSHVIPYFPMGTLISNVIAGLFIGLIIGLEEQAFHISSRTKLFLTTGLLGGLSTFSTFSLETINFFRENKYMWALGNITVNLVFSLLGVVLGMYIGKIILK